MYARMMIFGGCVQTARRRRRLSTFLKSWRRSVKLCDRSHRSAFSSAKSRLSGRRACCDACRRRSRCPAAVHRQGMSRSRADADTSFAVQAVQRGTVEKSQFQFNDRVVDPSCATENRCHRCSSGSWRHVQRSARWSMVLLCSSQAYVMEETAETQQLQIEQQHGEARTPTAQHPESEKPSR